MYINIYQGQLFILEYRERLEEINEPSVVAVSFGEKLHREHTYYIHS